MAAHIEEGKVRIGLCPLFVGIGGIYEPKRGNPADGAAAAIRVVNQQDAIIGRETIGLQCFLSIFRNLDKQAMTSFQLWLFFCIVTLDQHAFKGVSQA